MSIEEITRMIVDDTFTEAFNSYQRDKIKKIWAEGKYREAQGVVMAILDDPKFIKPKTLL